eukprot:TRINITY_DN3359_c1_g1_i4.p1 TRINITY_DN3359_c1_g1~~TRINITY_DN3359_c1_g1_i4.p1  ORF type:complete len:234 (+),score=76.84 TRINITY_DN3359_c1_g1_i4:81-704(+)
MALARDEEGEQRVAKLVLLGDQNVGKSSLVLQFVNGKFFETREPTIGAAFLAKTVTVDDQAIKFEIWDTAGQERYHSLAPMYYREAAAALVVFDITSQDTFDRAQKWLTELYKAGSDDMVIALVGNKSDLPGREVDTSTAKEFAKEQSLLFQETSAKLDKGVDDVFKAVARKLISNTPKPKPKHASVQLQDPPPSGAAPGSDDGCPC